LLDVFISIPPCSSDLLKRLYEIPAAYLTIYLCLSFVFGWFLGAGRGLIELWQVVRWVVAEDSWAGRLLRKYFERYFITGRPIIYDALFPDLDENGDSKTVYAEIVLKEHQGSITGRVASFSIANDEECHKLIYLEDVYQTKTGSSIYKKIDADGLLVDIADAITLQIKQV
jgi:hypothetical protein